MSTRPTKEHIGAAPKVSIETSESDGRERKGDLAMVMFKACPRCMGDMHVNKDMYGEYRECLMCGFMADIAKQSAIGIDLAAAANEKKTKPRARTRKVAVKAA